jgi:hypothetical protein
MIFLGLVTATAIWYRWFRGDVPYHKTWEEVQRDYDIKHKKI